jgi:uncharacterized protein
MMGVKVIRIMDRDKPTHFQMSTLLRPDFLKKTALMLLLLPALAKAACIDVSLGGTDYCLVVADTDQTLKKGLQGRRSLGKHEGMLFVFAEDAPRVFWMKDTLLTLDIIFLDEQGILRSMASRVSPGKIRLYGSARYVIELAGGTAEKLNLWPGDRIILDTVQLKHD